jgi:hypothetical protein
MLLNTATATIWLTTQLSYRKTKNFLCKLSYPLTVQFFDEPGLDCVAIHADFVWKLLEKI